MTKSRSPGRIDAHTECSAIHDNVIATECLNIDVTDAVQCLLHSYFSRLCSRRCSPSTSTTSPRTRSSDLSSLTDPFRRPSTRPRRLRPKLRLASARNHSLQPTTTRRLSSLRDTLAFRLIALNLLLSLAFPSLPRSSSLRIPFVQPIHHDAPSLWLLPSKPCLSFAVLLDDRHQALADVRGGTTAWSVIALTNAQVEERIKRRLLVDRANLATSSYPLNDRCELIIDLRD